MACARSAVSLISALRRRPIAWRPALREKLGGVHDGLMSTISLPDPIQEFIDATNAGDTERFVAAFTDDAYVNDWGREFHGQAGVRSWDRTDNIGKQSHFEVLEVSPGQDVNSYVVTATVTGNGFNGTGPLEFVLRDGRIASLRMS